MRLTSPVTTARSAHLRLGNGEFTSLGLDLLKRTGKQRHVAVQGVQGASARLMQLFDFRMRSERSDPFEDAVRSLDMMFYSLLRIANLFCWDVKYNDVN